MLLKHYFSDFEVLKRERERGREGGREGRGKESEGRAPDVA